MRNLLILHEIGGNPRKILKKLFDDKTITLEDLKTLIKAVAEVSNQGAKFENGSTFNVTFPCTQLEWPRNDDGGFEITPALQVTFYGWTHHDGSGHNDGTLGNKTVKRCLHAFTSAGITPHRLEKARLQSLQEKRPKANDF